MNPVIGNLPAGASNSVTAPGIQPPKVAPSAFDKIKNQTGNGADSAGQPTSPTNPPDVAKVQDSLATTQSDLARLKDKVAATSKLDGMSGLQGRLSSLEHQYAQVSQAASQLPPDASQQQMLALQQKVYSMNEGISALSKIVSQTTSGVKTMLQTQV
jgi:uncharacterized phage infection (PIP) family protein YhgE